MTEKTCTVRLTEDEIDEVAAVITRMARECQAEARVLDARFYRQILKKLAEAKWNDS